jgi:hypothetical protein
MFLTTYLWPETDPVFETLCLLAFEHRTMDKVQKLSDSDIILYYIMWSSSNSDEGGLQMNFITVGLKFN